MSFLPEPSRSPAQSSPSRLPTLSLSRRPTVGAAEKENATRQRKMLPQPASSKATGPAAQAEKQHHPAEQSGQPAVQPKPMNRTQSLRTKLAAAKKVEDPARQAMPPPAAPSGVGRTQSQRIPTAGQTTRTSGLRAPTKTGAPAGAPKSGHVSQASSGRNSRQGSSATAAASTSQNNAPLQKPGQRERLRAATVSSPQAERTRPAAGPQRIPPVPSSGPKPSGAAAKHSRSRSELPNATARPQSGIASSRGMPGLEMDPKLVAKPAFSTLQQHYSPKKTLEPKKATASFFHASSVSAGGGEALPGEVLALQAELLQLHMLHESSSKVQAQWERSAERALRLQFYEVATAHHNMRKNESEVQELVNLHALQEWSSGSATFGLAENIQLLGPLLNELRALTDSGGRHTRVVQEFEQWMGRAEQVWAGRAAARRVEVVEGLGDEWRVEAAALVRKVSGLAREADRLVAPAWGSSISSVVMGCRALVEGMVGELQLMRRVEAEVGEDEARFVEQGVQGIAAQTEHSQALWREV